MPAFRFSEAYMRARIIGAMLAVAGAVTLLYFRDEFFLKLGVGAIFIGLFMCFVVTERSVPQELSATQFLAHTELLHSLIKNLNLDGNGIYMPRTQTRMEERVFIPLAGANPVRIPSLVHDNTFFQTSASSDMGLVIVPPGLRVLELCESYTNIKLEGSDIEGIGETLQFLTYGFGIVKNISVRRHGRNIYVRFTHSGYDALCRKIRSTTTRICNQCCCPVCSVILCALTRATGSTLCIRNIKLEKNVVNMEIYVAF